MNYVKKTILLNSDIRSRLESSGKVKPEKLSVIHNGVDTDVFSPDINTDSIKEKYKLNGKINILFVGGFTPRKGIEYLIKSANIIVNRLNYKDILFLLVGPHREYGFLVGEEELSYPNKIFRLIKNFKLENNVRITGTVSFDDLRKLYAACDIAACPSLAEAGPLVTLEAMSSGKPVIGTKVGGMPLQIKDGWNGFLVEPANEEQLAEKIKYLIDNPKERKRMGKNSRKLAEKEFSWESVTKKYLEIYNN